MKHERPLPGLGLISCWWTFYQYSTFCFYRCSALNRHWTRSSMVSSLWFNSRQSSIPTGICYFKLPTSFSQRMQMVCSLYASHCTVIMQTKFVNWTYTKEWSSLRRLTYQSVLATRSTLNECTTELVSTVKQTPYGTAYILCWMNHNHMTLYWYMSVL